MRKKTEINAIDAEKTIKASKDNRKLKSDFQILDSQNNDSSKNPSNNNQGTRK